MSNPFHQRLSQLTEGQRQALAQKLGLLTNEKLVAHVIAPDTDTDTLRKHLAERLPPFMIPPHIVSVATFPKTANGKVDRQALAHTLSKPTKPIAPSNVEASNRLEIGMAAVWAEALGIDEVAVTDNFFELGGNSLIMVKLIGKIHETFAIKLPMTAIGAAPTVQQLLRQIEDEGHEVSWPFLVPIREEGNKAPFFLVHGLGGGIFDYYRLKPHLPQDRPFYAIQAPLEPYDNLEEMAEAYLKAIREVQPEGPYHLGGYCLGAVVAFELAQQLNSAGDTTDVLALIESSPPRRPLSNPAALGNQIKQRAQHFMASSREEKAAFVRNKWTNLAKRLRHTVTPKGDGDRGFAVEAEDYFDLNGYPIAYREIVRVHFRALRDYKPHPYSGPATIFQADDNHWTRQDPTLGWSDWIKGDLKTVAIAGNHHNTLHDPQVADLGRKLSSTLDDSDKDA
ncbi:alpha/beta fold hydrolase [Verrucomicrobiales bacterium]|nr:alpha/beta fold hydrolase [Verrucomicrobiales bacterium]